MPLQFLSLLNRNKKVVTKEPGCSAPLSHPSSITCSVLSRNGTKKGGSRFVDLRKKDEYVLAGIYLINCEPVKPKQLCVDDHVSLSPTFSTTQQQDQFSSADIFFDIPISLDAHDNHQDHDQASQGQTKHLTAADNKSNRNGRRLSHSFSRILQLTNFGPVFNQPPHCQTSQDVAVVAEAILPSDHSVIQDMNRTNATTTAVHYIKSRTCSMESLHLPALSSLGQFDELKRKEQFHRRTSSTNSSV
eukprot:c7947_g1_i2.p1 GENE.c7947_g1_i2~~c7947_g1_i2.p1  ORF type:complete len:246 (-),score=43.94 c7947_g1_i2:196-933(-)